MPLEEGKAAPAFTLPDQDGAKVSLRDFKGRNVILYFYPRDDTPGCTKEAQAFKQLARKFEKLDTVIVGVSPDGAEQHTKFRAKYKLPFPLLSDVDRSVMNKYGAFGEKKMYAKTVQGVIRSTVWIGPDGKVKKHWARVAKAADHPQKVLEAMAAEAGS